MIPTNTCLPKVPRTDRDLGPGTARRSRGLEVSFQSPPNVVLLEKKKNILYQPDFLNTDPLINIRIGLKSLEVRMEHGGMDHGGMDMGHKCNMNVGIPFHLKQVEY